MRWFNSLPRLIQFILLLIPFVNWVVEIWVRLSAFLHKGSLLNLIIFIVVFLFGIVWGWVDLIWVLLFRHLIFAGN